MHVRALLVIAVTVLAPPGLGAQVASPSPSAAPRTAVLNTITAADLARHIGVIAHDSMLGRDTPSRGLEQTAQYVAAQFQALGLEPPGDSGSFVQRYPVPGYIVLDTTPGKYWGSHLWFAGKPKKAGKPAVDEAGEPLEARALIDFGRALFVASDTVVDYRAPGARGGGLGSTRLAEWYGPPPVLVAGPHTLESVRRANLRDTTVVYIPSSRTDSVLQRHVIELLQGSNNVIVVGDDDSASFAARRARMPPPVILPSFVTAAQHPRRSVVYVWAPAIRTALAAAGVDVADARTSPTPIVRGLTAVVVLRLAAADSTPGPMAPNTIGLLPGSDSSQGRSSHVIVLTAHMDHTGVRHGQADSIANGADDNASGVAALLELAQALTHAARARGPLRHPILFAAVSGGAKELWGSKSFVDQWFRRPDSKEIALNLNLDRLGRAARDSIRISGLQDVELPVRPAWLAARHPELRLTVVDDGSAVTANSDHLAFIQRAIPSLYVHGGDHDTASGTAALTDTLDTPAAVDPEQEARLVQYLLVLVQEIADAPEAARFGWTSAGRRRRLEAFGQ